jgi:hypothetical protein
MIVQPASKFILEPELLSPDSDRRWQFSARDERTDRLGAHAKIFRDVMLIDFLVHRSLQRAVVPLGVKRTRLSLSARTIRCHLDQILDQYARPQLPSTSVSIPLLPRNSLNILTLVNSTRQTKGEPAA